MSKENPYVTLKELFIAYNQAPELSRPVWRASFDICCMAWDLDPKKEWERECRAVQQERRDVH